MYHGVSAGNLNDCVPAFLKLRYLCCVSRSHLEITFGELRNLVVGDLFANTGERVLRDTSGPYTQCVVGVFL